jgi:hypothetical protein
MMAQYSTSSATVHAIWPRSLVISVMMAANIGEGNMLQHAGVMKVRKVEL